MKPFLRCTLLLLFLPSFNGFAKAQGGCGTDYGCVVSFSLSPGEVMGDGSHYASATIIADLAPNEHGQWTASLTESGGPGFICANGTAVYAQLNGCHVTGSAATIYFFAYNGSGSPVSLPIKAQDDTTRDTGISQTLVVDPMPTSFLTRMGRVPATHVRVNPLA